MVLFRIPFTSMFMLPALFSVVVGYVLFTILFDNIRQNLENKDNLVFGVKINDKMFKFKLQTGLDILTFSLDTKEKRYDCFNRSVFV